MSHLECGGHGLEDGMMGVERRKPANNGAYSLEGNAVDSVAPNWAGGGGIRIVTEA